MKVLQEVLKAYADSHLPFDEAATVRQLDFRASAPLASDTTELQEALSAIGRYNEFDPVRVAEGLAHYDCDVVIARENSVCLYIFVLGGANPRAEVKQSLRDLRADEIDDRPDGSIRAWWD